MNFKKSILAFSAILFLASFLLYSEPDSGVATDRSTASRQSLKGSSPLVADDSVVSGTLSNGIGWRVIKNAEPANRIFLRLVVKAGSVLEDDDQKGVAHLIEHMAFNGTEHFAKNELVDYFESIGMAFGPEVNAYTGFDETVYMLEVPADDPAALDRALLVFRDWACAIALDPAELDKERGVVVEEWRLGRGAHGRTQDKQIPFIFNGSKYASRLPIGDPEIVKTVSRERVADFYRAWYRPELMSVVLVGDAEVSHLSSAIDRALGAIPPTKKGAPMRPEVSGPSQKKPDALVIRDPELTYSSLQLMEQTPAPAMRTVADFRKRVAENMAISIFNRRLEEKILQADPKVLGARLGLQRIVKPTRFTSFGVVPVNGLFADGFTQMMEELFRIETYGVTDGELAREKRSALDDIEQAWLDRAKIHSSNRAGAVVQSVLYGDPVLSVDTRRDLYRAVVPEITAKEIGSIINGWFTDRGKLLVAFAPDSATDVPDRDALLALWQTWKPQAPLAPYSETGLDRPLFPPVSPSTAVGASSSAKPAEVPIVRGSVVSERTLSANGIREWVLSNGARVVSYRTDFKANEILVTAVSNGGTSLVSDADYPSASMASMYAESSGLNGFSAVELQKKLAGKTASVEAWIDDYREGLAGTSSVVDLETLFQLINLRFTGQTFTPEAWQSIVTQLKTLAASRESSPDEMFSDLKVRLLYGDSIRHANLSDGMIAKMDSRRAESAYRGRFADASDFIFVFVGSFDEATLKEYAETYLASLPSSRSKESAIDDDIDFPKGIKGDVLRMGIDPQSTVFLSFGGKPAIGRYEYELFTQLLTLLDIRFREVIREDMSGSYGVSANGYVTAYPVPAWELDIDFGCEPGREDALTEAVFKEIAALAASPVPDAYITKLREGVRRGQETALRNNRFWATRIAQEILRGRSLDGIGDTEAIIAAITGESMQAMVKKYLPTDNYVKAVLVPAEKAEAAVPVKAGSSAP